MGLIKKAYEYSELCDADVCLGIRLRGSGHVFTFLSDPAGFWSKFDSLLVRNMRARLSLHTNKEARQRTTHRQFAKQGKISKSRSGDLGPKDQVPVAVRRPTVSGNRPSLGL